MTETDPKRAPHSGCRAPEHDASLRRVYLDDAETRVTRKFLDPVEILWISVACIAEVLLLSTIGIVNLTGVALVG
jgi:hypothetical protein